MLKVEKKLKSGRNSHGSRSPQRTYNKNKSDGTVNIDTNALTNVIT